MSDFVYQAPELTPPAFIQNENFAEAETRNFKFIAPGTIGDALTISAPNGDFFKWQPGELAYIDESGIFDYIQGSTPATAAIFEHQARYARTYPNADEVFIVEGDGVKHYTILNEPPRPAAEYLEGKIKFGISGKIEGLNIAPGIYETIETNSFIMPPIYIKDLKGNEYTGHYEIQNIDGGQYLYIWLDESILKEAVYPLFIDPTLIVNSSKYNSGMKNKRIAKDSKGNLYFVTFDYLTVNNPLVFKSVDEGQTWANLNFPALTGGSFVNPYILIDKNDTIYIIGAGYDANTGTTINKIKQCKYTNGVWGTIENIASETGYIDLELGAPALDVDGLSIHLVYSINNVVKYSKLTNGAYSTPAILGLTTSYYKAINPLILQDKQNNLWVFANLVTYTAEGEIKSIFAIKSTGGTWGTWTKIDPYADTSTKTISSAIVDDINKIHIIWQGKGDGSGPYVELFYMVYDGTWNCTNLSSLKGITTTSAKDGIIGYDSLGKLHLIYQHGGLPSNIKYMSYLSGVWSAIVNIQTSTDQIITPLAMTEKLNSNSKFNYVYAKTIASSSRVDILSDNLFVNYAPNVPTNLNRANFDATTDAAFSWTFTDSNGGDKQSAYQLVITRVSDGVTVKDTGKVTSQTSTYMLPAGILANNINYQWKVKVWDQYGLESSYSSPASFTTSSKPTATITTPAADGDSINTNLLTVNWAYSDAGNSAQSAYQIQILDNDNVVKFDTTKITEQNTRTKTVSFALDNNTTYKVKLIVWNSNNIQSTDYLRTFITSFTQPFTPTLTAQGDNAAAAVTINIANPAINMLGTAGECENLNDFYISSRLTSSIDTSYKVSGNGSYKGVVNNITGGFYVRFKGVKLDNTKYYCLSVTVKNQLKTSELKLRAVETTGGTAIAYPANDDTKAICALATTKRIFMKIGPTHLLNYEFIGFDVYNPTNETLTGGILNLDAAMIQEISQAEYNNNNYIPGEFTSNGIKVTNEVYRRKTGESEFVKIAAGIGSNGAYVDRTPASGKQYEYKVRAIGDNTAYIESNIETATINMQTAILSLTTDYTKAVTLKYLTDRTERPQVERELLKFAGRKNQVAEFSEHDSNALSIKFNADNEALETLNSFILSRVVMLYRDTRGRREFVSIDSLEVQDDKPTGYIIVCNPVKISYIEGV